jgi:uncharacterized protein (DUF2267 family)
MQSSRIAMRSELIARVAEHTGLGEREAEAVVVAVLAALRADLGAPEAEALAERLPGDLAEPLRRGRYTGALLVPSVAAAEAVRMAQAQEHASAVCGALAEACTPSSRATNRRCGCAFSERRAGPALHGAEGRAPAP